MFWGLCLRSISWRAVLLFPLQLVSIEVFLWTNKQIFSTRFSPFQKQRFLGIFSKGCGQQIACIWLHSLYTSLWTRQFARETVIPVHWANFPSIGLVVILKILPMAIWFFLILTNGKFCKCFRAQGTEKNLHSRVLWALVEIMSIPTTIKDLRVC